MLNTSRDLFFDFLRYFSLSHLFISLLMPLPLISFNHLFVLLCLLLSPTSFIQTLFLCLSFCCPFFRFSCWKTNFPPLDVWLSCLIPNSREFSPLSFDPKGETEPSLSVASCDKEVVRGLGKKNIIWLSLFYFTLVQPQFFFIYLSLCSNFAWV